MTADALLREEEKDAPNLTTLSHQVNSARLNGIEWTGVTNDMIGINECDFIPPPPSPPTVETMSIKWSEWEIRKKHRFKFSFAKKNSHEYWNNMLILSIQCHWNESNIIVIVLRAEYLFPFINGVDALLLYFLYLPILHISVFVLLSSLSLTTDNICTVYTKEEKERMKRKNMNLILMNLNLRSIFVSMNGRKKECCYFALLSIHLRYNYIFETTQQTLFNPRNVSLTATNIYLR